MRLKRNYTDLGCRRRSSPSRSSSSLARLLTHQVVVLHVVQLLSISVSRTLVDDAVLLEFNESSGEDAFSIPYLAFPPGIVHFLKNFYDLSRAER